MNLKERIEHITKEINLWQESYDTHVDGCNAVALRDLREAEEIIKKQEEIIKIAKYAIEYGLGSSVDDIRIRSVKALNKIKEMEENDTDSN